ncbi:MAG: 50S ribosomal protein L25 [Phycisphaeraceae bacterium]|nr:50S ribosomal protein L25 [Phycisphaeraceae bacterium]MCB9848278.1 50S ribosomal protein L25 [Phycisphaeraceae bacterium]
MSTTFTLEAKPRDKAGSRYARRLRNAGELPCVLYGHKQGPVSLSIDAKTALGHFAHGEKVFVLDIAGKKENALLKDLQFDYLGNNVIHADFERVDLDEEVETHLHIVLKGEAVGLKSAGAILLTNMTEITVRCKVRDILEHLDVDISELGSGSSLHAGEITLPAGMTLVGDPDDTICSIQMVRHEEAVGEEAAVEGAQATEPEVITEKKEASED